MSKKFEDVAQEVLEKIRRMSPEEVQKIIERRKNKPPSDIAQFEKDMRAFEKFLREDAGKS